MNLGDDDWTSVDMKVNGVVWGYYEHEVPRIPAGNVYTVGVILFTKSDGTRFNPFLTKVQQIIISAHTKKGLGVASKYFD
jgi:hypothetical protein